MFIYTLPTELGRVIVDKKVQFAKAEAPIVVTLLGLSNVTLVMFLPEKAEVPIVVTGTPFMLAGMVMGPERVTPGVTPVIVIAPLDTEVVNSGLLNWK